MMAPAFSSPYALERFARHSSSVGRCDMRLPSSLTEPISIGTSFEIVGAASKNERMLMILPSTHGDQPTRGVPGPPGPIIGGPGGLILAAAAFPDANSFDHSTFCSEPMSFGARPSSFIVWR